MHFAAVRRIVVVYAMESPVAGRDHELGLHDPVVAVGGLEDLAALSAEEFRERFRGTPVMRAKHEGMLRNVAAAMNASAEVRE